MPPKARHADPMHQQQPPPAEEADYSDEEEEFDLAEVMKEMTPGERRKVYALYGLLEDYKAIRAKHMAAIAQLQLENHKALEAIFRQRAEIVTGVRDITAEEVAALPASASPAAPEDAEKGVTVVAPSDEAANAALVKAAADPAGGIPNFWLTAMSNSEVLSGLITERDRPALAALQDINCEYVDGDPSKGVVITFSFDKNEYFTDEKLTKTYHMEYNEDDGDVEVADIVGCEVHWTDPKHNLTVVVKEKKQRNKKNNQIRVVQREEKCESFFNFFSPPQPPASDADDDDADEDGEFYEQEMEMDVEAGQALMEEVVPKAAYYYSGKSIEEVAKMLAAQFGFGADDDDDDEEEEEEEEEEEGDGQAFRDIVNQRGRGRGRGGAAGGRGGAAGAGAGGAPQQQQECKQQ